MVKKFSATTLAALADLDSCSVANAIETFDLRLRNEGFTNSRIGCFTPQLPPMVGFAETLRVRTSTPPPERHTYLDRSDWWMQMAQDSRPRVLVIEDVDSQSGLGAFIGYVHARIFKAIGCVGVLTNGAVRDLPDVMGTGFHLFAGNVSPSHAYVHVVEYGVPVEVAGLRICPGDLLHGDLHGVVSVPMEIADQIPTAAARMKQREEEIVSLCQSGSFSIDNLRRLVTRS